MDRRGFLKQAAVVTGGMLWAAASSESVAAQPVVGDGPYGPLLPPNADGLQLPVGFTSRLIAMSGVPVANTAHVFHLDPDGGACRPLRDGGWIYISNSESPDGRGGVAAIAFNAAGQIVDAYPILTGTTRSCSGGMTPRGTYLSGEENAVGGVFECDPTQRSQGIHRPLLGCFLHEMIAVDPADGAVYMVEDAPEGRFYRFQPRFAGNFTSGTLYAAHVGNGNVSWVPTRSTEPDRAPTTTAFNGGEGVWIMGGLLYFTTKGDSRVWRLHLATQQLSVWYDALSLEGTPLTAPDNLLGHPASGDLFVAEDGGNLEAVLLTTRGPAQVAPFLRFVGHDTSEVTGLAFSPDGMRFYVTSQRGSDGVNGSVYEVSGPFRRNIDRWSLKQLRSRGARRGSLRV